MVTIQVVFKKSVDKITFFWSVSDHRRPLVGPLIDSSSYVDRRSFEQLQFHSFVLNSETTKTISYLSSLSLSLHNDNNRQYSPVVDETLLTLPVSIRLEVVVIESVLYLIKWINQCGNYQCWPFLVHCCHTVEAKRIVDHFVVDV